MSGNKNFAVFDDPAFAEAVKRGEYNLHWRKAKRYGRYASKLHSKGFRRHVRRMKAKTKGNVQCSTL